MIVLDASVAVPALLKDGPARRLVAEERVHVPHLIDSEVLSVVRRKVTGHEVAAMQGWSALDTWRRLGIVRHPAREIMARMWELRDNLSAYDATYVALAEALDCALVTADRRLARALGVRCPVTVLPD